MKKKTELITIYHFNLVKYIIHTFTQRPVRFTLILLMLQNSQFVATAVNFVNHRYLLLQPLHALH